MFVEFKEAQKFASVIADQSEFHESFKDAGYVLTDSDLIVDIDNLPKETIEKMVQAFDIKTQIVWTDRGCHLYFAKPKAFKGTRSVCPLGFEVEYKHKKNTKAITIKRGGQLREIDNLGVRDELPDYLYIRTKLDTLQGLDEGDGRNQKLYAHKFKIMSCTNYKKILSFVNNYVFANPLDAEEFTTIARDEEIKAEKNMEYDVAVQLQKQLKVVKYSDRLYNYDGQKYIANSEFKTLIAKYLRGQKTAYIDEVIKQMEYHIEPIEEPVIGFDIRFKNGILRNGKFIHIESSEFTPYYIDVDYNDESEPVAYVDEYLDFLTDGDKDYRQLILECMAHTLITNAEFKRQLAKFFVFIGDGGNGKGTMLTIIRKILGQQNCSSLSPEEMTKESYFTSLAGRLVNLGDDIEDKAINEKQMKVLKNISTCDFVSSRELFKQSKEVVMTTTLIFTSNHLLKSFEKGESYKRRVVWCPMFGKILKKDAHFITKLTSAAAIEYWVKLIMDAYFDLYKNAGFTESEKVSEYNHSYHEENNGTLTFIRDHKPEDFIGLRPPLVYEEYETWAEENGVTVQSKKILRETLETEMGLVVKAKLVNGKTAKVYMEK
jgi:putative DNA primase/helicase